MTIASATSPPSAEALVGHIGRSPLTPAARAAVRRHLAQPALPVADLAAQASGSLDEVLAAYAFVRRDPIVQAHIRSLLYAQRLRTTFATATVAEWLADPTRVDRLLAGEPVLARTVELHASKGTCTYRCQMCLWSDQDELTYTSRDLRAAGPLTTRDWCRLLDELHASGAHTVVLSGGGEVLLNRDVPSILGRARRLGLAVHLYTTGYHLGPDRSDLLDEVAQLDQVRFSIHSPQADTYDQITGLPSRLAGLTRVSDNVAALLARRDQLGTRLRVGVGFVTQPSNLTQICDMAEFAATAGVDFLDIRKDEVDVTAALSDAQLVALRSQIIELRHRAHTGRYPGLYVDIGDELVAAANGEPIDRARTAECLAKYIRPAISPFGIMAPCDLIAEPRFANTHLTLGPVGRTPLQHTVARLAHRTILDACPQCMPSSRTGNAIYNKLLIDLRAGIALTDQPFHPAKGVAAQ